MDLQSQAGEAAHRSPIERSHVTSARSDWTVAASTLTSTLVNGTTGCGRKELEHGGCHWNGASRDGRRVRHIDANAVTWPGSRKRNPPGHRVCSDAYHGAVGRDPTLTATGSCLHLLYSHPHRLAFSSEHRSGKTKLGWRRRNRSRERLFEQFFCWMCS